MQNLRIVFMGTPQFAIATLGALLMNGFNIVGVVTVPDKPAGRGRQIKKSPVKEFAEFSSLSILQPDNLKDPVFISELKKLKADLFIVVAFRMLPEVVWKMPSMGTINLHASLLPHYRGAAPINHAIMNGETITGVTTFFIDEKIDTGNILLSEEVRIMPSENAGDLHDRLMILGARLIIKSITDIAENKIMPVSQTVLLKSGESPRLAPKIHPEDCIIDWNNDLVQIYNHIRGLAPYPCARSVFKNELSTHSYKIFESLPEVKNHSFRHGQVISDGKNIIKVACRGGFINISSLQLEGKKRMSTVEFLRGFRISDYSVPLN